MRNGQEGNRYYTEANKQRKLLRPEIRKKIVHKYVNLKKDSNVDNYEPLFRKNDSDKFDSNRQTDKSNKNKSNKPCILVQK